ncbi:MAG: DNA gyrase inhibitor YacG [Planctomycetota bacterium]|jgi:endogenous inhibitor of DNA gyrase (YacG/DUF329 family)
MTAPTRARCPHCRKAVATDPATRPADYPFCSERCRLLDLHKWLNGDYSIPTAAPNPHELAEE